MQLSSCVCVFSSLYSSLVRLLYLESSFFFLCGTLCTFVERQGFACVHMLILIHARKWIRMCKLITGIFWCIITVFLKMWFGDYPCKQYLGHMFKMQIPGPPSQTYWITLWVICIEQIPQMIMLYNWPLKIMVQVKKKMFNLNLYCLWIWILITLWKNYH